ncbi:thrombospondin type 3 repeat-containing protein [Nannocystis punicea]|uniref:Thrombospondin type 3 repeat-containing protein n=1 Tax=Nannocystis punicea TaxID=2995304 RepID=A0ABY7GS43_9BACT|nr:thrombospondin type 3 repeat-containing protein [Nannocystis poenicansa]WAS89746.1 thrombospondin type 3 repeat-containing protein [Nannocystis poenicansa]
MTHPHDRHPRRLLAAVLLALGACKPAELDPFETDSATDSGSTAGSTAGDDTGPGQTSSASTTADLTTSTTGDEPLPTCDEPVSDCKLDLDRDGLMFHCDNAPDYFNPDQSDVDGDGFGDVADLCPTLPGGMPAADSDKDGIGNACDLCARLPAFYNGDGAPISEKMKVRNIPQVEDSDHDGIGDACDNCVRTPNCGGYGDGLDPYQLGDPIDIDAADCQIDADADLIGDACAGTMLPGAAGPVGFGLQDDFDQDGLANGADTCPRQPVPLQACEDEGDCPGGAACVGGQCNHLDFDGDDVGDICDTCPWDKNPQQIQMGMAEENDIDGDFVGFNCETHPGAFETPDPRPFGFYDLSANGYCCVRQNAAGTTLDPDGNTVPLPAKVLNRPGVGALPPGCAQEGQPLNGTVDLATLWASFCLMPQLDQDFDGIGDVADLCRFSFDPDNTPFVDDENMQWDNWGKYCTGEYSPEHLDPAMMCLPGT